jgi:hypothetical protein
MSLFRIYDKSEYEKVDKELYDEYLKIFKDNNIFIPKEFDTWDNKTQYEFLEENFTIYLNILLQNYKDSNS